MKNNIPIRPARISDCVAIEKLGHVPEIAIAPNWYLPLAYYQRIVKNRHHIFLVAEIDHKIVGFTIAERIEAGFLGQYIVVDTKFRKLGIGHNLLSAVETEAKKRKAYFLLTYAVAKSPGIQAALKKSNYHRGQLTYEWSKGLVQRPQHKKLGAPKK